MKVEVMVGLDRLVDLLVVVAKEVGGVEGKKDKLPIQSLILCHIWNISLFPMSFCSLDKPSNHFEFPCHSWSSSWIIRILSAHKFLQPNAHSIPIQRTSHRWVPFQPGLNGASLRIEFPLNHNHGQIRSLCLNQRRDCIQY